MSADEKSPLFTTPPSLDSDKPPPYSWKPADNYPSPEQLFGSDKLDPFTLQKLNAVDNYGLYQGNRFGETVSCGCCANQYMITDRQRMTQVVGKEEALAEIPLWIIEEESELCCRVCCPQHPSLHKAYHALPPEKGPDCCCFYTGHRYMPDKSLPVAWVVERDGCCNKWVGCFICGPKCQSEAWVHGGDIESGVKPGSLGNSNPRVIGRSMVPKTDCFTPHLDMFENAGGIETQYAKLNGPCFFGGCYDIFCPTPFYINQGDTKGPIGDVGLIEKQPAKGFFDMCCQCAGDTDNYEVSLKQKEMTPLQKANVLGTALHVDNWFFQRDARPVRFHGNGNSGVIVITLCNMYCKGCVIPCCVTIPYGKK